MAAKAKKAGSKIKILRPGLLSMAAAAAWAAAHMPDRLGPASAGVWLVGSLTVGLLVRAGLALLAPGLALLGALLERALKSAEKEPEP